MHASYMTRNRGSGGVRPPGIEPSDADEPIGETRDSLGDRLVGEGPVGVLSVPVSAREYADSNSEFVHHGDQFSRGKRSLNRSVDV